MNLPLLLSDIAQNTSRSFRRQIDYLEVGVHQGRTALAVLSTGVIRSAVLIDAWDVEYSGWTPNVEQVRQLLKQYSPRIIVGSSHTELPKLEEQFDFGFVDGDHTAEGCEADMRDMLSKIRVGGVMVVDDLRHPGHLYLESVVLDFCKSRKLSVKTHFHESHYGVAEIQL